MTRALTATLLSALLVATWSYEPRSDVPGWLAAVCAEVTTC